MTSLCKSVLHWTIDITRFDDCWFTKVAIFLRLDLTLPLQMDAKSHLSFWSHLKAMLGNMELSERLTGVTLVTPTSSSRAFQDWEASSWCALVPLNCGKARGDEEDTSKPKPSSCRSWQLSKWPGWWVVWLLSLTLRGSLGFLYFLQHRLISTRVFSSPLH